MRLVQPGAIIERVYFAVPDTYTIGTTFDDWSSAVRFAQQQRADLIERQIALLGDYSTPEAIAQGVDAQVRIDLRWVIRNTDGTTPDMIVEKYHNVANLRP